MKNYSTRPGSKIDNHEENSLIDRNTIEINFNEKSSMENRKKSVEMCTVLSPI
jgi:hypothetical protein